MEKRLKAAEAGLAARRSGVAAIDAVLRRGLAFDDQLLDGLEARDRAFARSLIAVSLRRKGEAEAVLAKFLAKPLPKSSGVAKAILLTGAAQILFMRVPAHAAIDQAVSLAREDRDARHFSGLVNAVLRKVAQQGPVLLGGLDAARLNTPAWLLRRWSKAYGEEEALRISRAHGLEPALDLSLMPGRDIPPGVLLPTGTLRIAEPKGRIEDLPGYASGEWWVQDAAAALPAKLLGEMRDRSVLDLCAAPGGKTAQLAAAGARVTAVDNSAARMERLRANLARLRLKAETVIADALSYDPGPAFDAILLDAPCSATGTIRRHPDLPWIKTERQIAELAAVQSDMLRQAAKCVKPGGLLVYCTCSLESEECDAQIDRFLEQNQEIEREPIMPSEIGGEAHFITSAGDLRTLPFMAIGDHSGMDGFFAARLRLTPRH